MPVFLWSDLLFFALLTGCSAAVVLARRQVLWRNAFSQIAASRAGMAAATVLAVFILIALLDSLHYRPRLPGNDARYSVEVISVLDTALVKLKTNTEKTYSAPLATHSFAKESLVTEGVGSRDFPRLLYGGAQLGSDLVAYPTDLVKRTVSGLVAALSLWGALIGLARLFTRRAPHLAWSAVAWTLLLIFVIAAPCVALAQGYHVLGTDKVGQDVLYLSLKSIRTGVLIGTLTTLIMLPAAVLLGILAGYLGGLVDDVIQYLYTVLNSIPGVLLIAAAVLMMQVVIDTHADWFVTVAARADARFLALCAILGVTSWTGLCRLLRGETLKLRELEYVQAAQAFGVAPLTIMLRHILPNLMHIVIISMVMDFSGLVLAEAVLSYVGIGVDPNTYSFGSMINAARMELAREPIVWWPLLSAFSFMLVLVLAANVFADVVREAFDPKSRRTL